MWKSMDMMAWEHPDCCLRQVQGSESSLFLLEARKVQTMPWSPNEIPGLAGITGYGEVNKQAHTLEIQLWTPCTSRHDLCYKNAMTCSSGLGCSTARLYWTRDLGCVSLKRPIPPSWTTSSSPVTAAPTSFLPFCPETGTIPHFHTPAGLAGWERDMTGSARAGEGREGGKDQDKIHKFICVRHKDWNLLIVIMFAVRKVVPHLWWRSGSFPLLCTIFGGHRNVHRQSQVPEHKQGDATPVVLFPWQLIKGIQQMEGFCSPLHLTYLGYCHAEFDCHHGCSLELYKGVQRHKQKSALCSTLAGRTIWLQGGKNKKKKPVNQCHNDVFDWFKIRIMLFIHICSNVST